MDARDVLLRAAGLVQRGWSRGAFARFADGTTADPHARDAEAWCALGALRRASGKGVSIYDAADFLWRQIQDGQCIRGVAEWNDAPERTQAEVVAALRSAADKAGAA